ncbi:MULTISPECIES: hypothetical protein [unclassified Cupriavidus]|jgi:hypothetical protein|uniref:hypothetical protein n=1 Tax=unclassified Cupriavidus TaxID=2640874 RepID=UPI002270E137|nr:hypothetical protein [Cupriavidus sp. D39]MCY0853821.1 hypothetical protein [Cupriavidus sp. D39]
MRAQIDEGTLEIWGENPTETWALGRWHKEHRISAGTVSIYPVSPEIEHKPLLGSMEGLVVDAHDQETDMLTVSHRPNGLLVDAIDLAPFQIARIALSMLLGRNPLSIKVGDVLDFYIHPQFGEWVDDYKKEMETQATKRSLTYPG